MYRGHVIGFDSEATVQVFWARPVPSCARHCKTNLQLATLLEGRSCPSGLFFCAKRHRTQTSAGLKISRHVSIFRRNRLSPRLALQQGLTLHRMECWTSWRLTVRKLVPVPHPSSTQEPRLLSHPTYAFFISYLGRNLSNGRLEGSSLRTLRTLWTAPHAHIAVTRRQSPASCSPWRSVM